MIEVAQVIHSFFSGFQIPAYLEENIPDDATLPYITYTFSVPEWNEQTSLQVRVWYEGNSVVPVFTKVDEILNAVGYGGISIPFNTGSVVIYKDNPTVQLQPYDSPDRDIKVAYLNLILEVN